MVQILLGAAQLLQPQIVMFMECMATIHVREVPPRRRIGGGGVTYAPYTEGHRPSALRMIQRRQKSKANHPAGGTGAIHSLRHDRGAGTSFDFPSPCAAMVRMPASTRDEECPDDHRLCPLQGRPPPQQEPRGAEGDNSPARRRRLRLAGPVRALGR